RSRCIIASQPRSRFLRGVALGGRAEEIIDAKTLGVQRQLDIASERLDDELTDLPTVQTNEQPDNLGVSLVRDDLLFVLLVQRQLRQRVRKDLADGALVRQREANRKIRAR